MSPISITVKDLEDEPFFDQIMERVEKGESFLVEENGEVVAALVPYDLYRKEHAETEALTSRKRSETTAYEPG